MLGIDIVKILGYGLIGLAAICVLASMTLISKESSKENPNKEVLKTIRLFMVIGLVALFVVGVFSLPTLNKNKSMSNESVGKLASDLKEMSTNFHEISDEYNKLKAKYEELDEKCEDKDPDYKPPKLDVFQGYINYNYINTIDSLSVVHPKNLSIKNLEFILNNEAIKK